MADVRTGRPTPACGSLETVVACHGAAPRVVVRGAVDLATADGLARCLDRVLSTASRRAVRPELLVDLSGVSFLACVGLTVLLDAGSRTEAAGGRLRVRAVPGPARRTIELAGLGSRLLRP